MTVRRRQMVGLGTILWVAALILVTYAPGLLKAAPGEEGTAWSEARLDLLQRDLSRREVVLEAPGTGRVWRLAGAEVGLTVDRVATVTLAGSAHPPAGSPSLPVLRLETWRIKSLLRERVAGTVRVDSVPARLDEQGGIVPDRPGRQLDLSEAVRRVSDAFLHQQASGAPVRVAIPLETVRADVTASRLEALAPWELLASYTTRFDPAAANRASNIRLGVSLLDGTLLEPGDTFSFNRVVGPRTEARGFKPAPVIISRQLVSGLGGGVCQLSSTTYNAALLSGLEVLDRQHHSMPVGYLPIGRDATVYDDLIDLRFRNSLAHPVMVQGHVEGERLTVAIWGHPGDRRRIDIRVRTVESLPPPLEWEEESGGAPPLTAMPGGRATEGLEVVDPGRTGYLVEVQRVFYGADGEVDRVELLSRDLYPPEPRRVRVARETGS